MVGVDVVSPTQMRTAFWAAWWALAKAVAQVRALAGVQVAAVKHAVQKVAESRITSVTQRRNVAVAAASHVAQAIQKVVSPGRRVDADRVLAGKHRDKGSAVKASVKAARKVRGEDKGALAVME